MISDLGNLHLLWKRFGLAGDLSEAVEIPENL